MFFVGNLLYIIVLLVNAVAVLSEDRFLARINLSHSSYQPAFGQSTDVSIQSKLINLISSIRTIMRAPLIIINTLIVVYELVLG